MQAPTTLLAQIAGSIGPGEPVGVNLDIDFALPAELFDDIDFSEAATDDSASWQDLLVAGLEDHGVLEVNVTRTTN